MSELIEIANKELQDIWYNADKLEEIKKLICPSAPLTDMEFDLVKAIGRTTQLNPFMREIWVIKYKNKQGSYYPATIFVGRDGYRKCAQRNPDYDYHQADAVYENDEFCMENGVPKHKYNLKDRGQLLGAYCVAKRKNSSRPSFVYCELKEYKQNQGLWISSNQGPAKTATMIKKVAESQCLRACFQDMLGGTYSDAELPPEAETIIVNDHDKDEPLNSLEKKLRESKALEKKEPVTYENVSLINNNQLDEVNALLSVKAITEDRISAALNHYQVNSIDEMTDEKASNFIRMLNKLADK